MINKEWKDAYSINKIKSILKWSRRRFSTNSEIFVSDFFENREEVFILYYMDSDMFVEGLKFAAHVIVLLVWKGLSSYKFKIFSYRYNNVYMSLLYYHSLLIWYFSFNMSAWFWLNAIVCCFNFQQQISSAISAADIVCSGFSFLTTLKTNSFQWNYSWNMPLTL